MIFSLKNDAGDILSRKRVKTDHNQAEKLLPSIMKLLLAKKVNLKHITRIKIANRGGSFTSLRIGVVTANALGYVLNIPVEGIEADEAIGVGQLMEDFDVVRPVYNKEPNITLKA